MTQKETAELFAVMKTLFPGADMFKAASQQELSAKLSPALELWTVCLKDIDYRIGKRAIIRVCQSCKFVPTVAEVRKACSNIEKEIENSALNAYIEARDAVKFNMAGLASDEFYSDLSENTQKVLSYIGGIDAFVSSGIFEMQKFLDAYKALDLGGTIKLPAVRPLKGVKHEQVLEQAY